MLGVCVTYKMGFGFDTQIYWAFGGHMKFVVEKLALRYIFSEYFGFPCQFSFYQMLRAAGQLVANVPSGLCITP
jgi:hypothetical protein